MKRVIKRKFGFRTFQVDYPLVRWIQTIENAFICLLLSIRFLLFFFFFLFTWIDYALSRSVFLLKDKCVFSTITKEIGVHSTAHMWVCGYMDKYQHTCINSIGSSQNFFWIIIQWYRVNNVAATDVSSNLSNAISNRRNVCCVRSPFPVAHKVWMLFFHSELFISNRHFTENRFLNRLPWLTCGRHNESERRRRCCVHWHW